MSLKDAEPKAVELVWLQFFYDNIDAGPATGTLKRMLRDDFERRYKVKLPEEYQDE